MNTIALMLAVMTPSSDSDLFNRLDRNRDGFIHLTEISSTQRPAFDRALRVADFNEDGRLSAKELQLALTDPEPIDVTRRNARQFDITRLDRNKDGKLTKDEVPQQLQSRMEQLFTVYGKEIPIELLKNRYQSGTQSKKSDPAEAKKGMDSSMQSQTQMRQTPKTEPKDTLRPSATTLRRLDRNKDGRLSRSEVPAAVWNRLKPFDLNSDNVIDRRELATGNRPLK